MHAAEQTSHDRAHVQGGTRNNTQHQQRVARNTAAETHRPNKKEPRECTTKLIAHGSPKATAQAEQSNTQQEQGKRLGENSEEFNILKQ